MSVDLYVLQERQGEITHAAGQAIFEPHARHELMEPHLRLSEEAAQRLADDLWDQGIRPTAAKSGSAEIEAIKAHIADLQKLIFSTQHERIPSAVLECFLKAATYLTDEPPTTEAIGFEQVGERA
jgi:hypothetical protein